MRTPLIFSATILLLVGFVLGDEPVKPEPPVKPVDPDPELVYAEQTLTGAKQATDGASLLVFFNARALTQADQDRLKAAIAKLGDDDFDVREKASAEILAVPGQMAMSYLRTTAETAKDIEVVARARRCMEEINNRTSETTLVPAAARVIAKRRPEGATNALLNCLPWLPDETLYEPVYQALAILSLKDGVPEPAIVAAAKDKEPTRRAAAAYVLGRGNAETRRAVAPLLADADMRVRFHAVAALVRAGDKNAVTPLLVLLTDAPTSVAWQAEDMLCRVAGDKAPSVGVGAGLEADRRKAREAWEAWWKENGEKIDLTKVNLDDVTPSGIIIAELGGRVWECGPDKKPRWEFNGASSPIDARMLPGGRVLVAEHGGQRVTERDRKGTILWEHRVTSQPVVCQRLPNGNTFIATYQDLQEVTPDHKVLYTHRSANGMIYHAEKMRDGSFLYVTSNSMVIELDATGKQTRSINTGAAGNTGGWASVEKLTNGNYLVALYSNSKVAEIDAAGKLIKSFTSPNPGHAMRLRNGNTLVANIEGQSVVEYDRDGKEVWRVASPGRPFHAWRR